jgi:hypothetical protein
MTAGTPISRSMVTERSGVGTMRSDRSALRWSKPQTNGGSRRRHRLVASPILVILHYLLKINTTFMTSVDAGKNAPDDPYRHRIATGQTSTSEARGQTW